MAGDMIRVILAAAQTVARRGLNAVLGTAPAERDRYGLDYVQLALSRLVA